MLLSKSHKLIQWNGTGEILEYSNYLHKHIIAVEKLLIIILVGDVNDPFCNNSGALIPEIATGAPSDGPSQELLSAQFNDNIDYIDLE